MKVANIRTCLSQCGIDPIPNCMLKYNNMEAIYKFSLNDISEIDNIYILCTNAAQITPYAGWYVPTEIDFIDVPNSYIFIGL